MQGHDESLHATLPGLGNDVLDNELMSSVDTVEESYCSNAVVHRSRSVFRKV